MTEPNKTFPQLQDGLSQRLYLWEARCVHPKFPSPLSLTASRVVIQQESVIWGCPPPKVRTIFMKGQDFRTITGAVTPMGRIYLREWNNKGVVLHELAHYFQWVVGQPMEHDAVFMRHLLRLLERQGITDLERSVRAYDLPF